MHIPHIRKTAIILFSVSIVVGTVLFGEDILNMALTPLPQGMRSCLSGKLGSTVYAQASCTSIVNEKSVAVWGDAASGTTGKLRESKLYEDYALGRVTHKGDQGLRLENYTAKYGFIDAENNIHIFQNAYWDPVNSWRAISSTANNASGKVGGFQTYLSNGEAFRVAADDTTHAADAAITLNPLLVVKTNGLVGIGNTTPAYTLDVTGNSRVTTNLEVGTNAHLGGAIDADGTLNSFGPASPYPGTQTGTIAISELTSTSGRLPWIQFHASGAQEAFLRLASASRVLEVGDSQGSSAGFAVMAPGNGSRNVYLSPNSNSYQITGNFGLGTSTPAYKLTLNTAGPAIGLENTGTMMAKNAAGAYEGFLWPRWSDNIMYMNYGSGGFNLRDNSNNSALYFDTSRNVQIGGSIACIAGQCPPNNLLRMTPNMHLNTPLGYATIINWDNGAAAAGTQEFRVGNGQGSDVFSVTNNQHVIIHSGGMLDVRGPGNAGPGIQIFSVGDNAGGLNTPYQMYANGYAGGATNVVHYIPNFTGAYQWYFGSAGGSLLKMSLNQAGTLNVNGTNYSSDIRLKKDIVPVTGSLDKLLQVEPVEFTWKENNLRNAGFIAQNIEKIFPVIVATDDKGYKSVGYSNMNAYIVEAIQELYKQFVAFKKDVMVRLDSHDSTIQKQQATIDAQQKKIDDLEQRLEKLEKNH